MELSRRPVRILSRLLYQSLRFTSNNVTGTAVKEDLNAELLKSFNYDIKYGGVVPVFRRALLFPSRVALHDDSGTYTYAGLYQAASVLSTEISAQLVGETEKTIGYMCGNDASHVIVQWAIWMSGNIAVPLTPLHPPDLLKYFLQDSYSSLVICAQEYENVLRPITLELSTPLVVTGKEKEISAKLYQPDSEFLPTKVKDEGIGNVGLSNSWYGDTDAMIIYTSGTTSKPKGVIWTHSMLQTQIASLHSAWQYSGNDVVLHTLPLHHIHGQLNSMLASLAAGARLRMLTSFAPHTVWSCLLGMGEKEDPPVSVFHGVPTMYARLAADYTRMFADKRTQDYVRGTLAKRVRLMCAGSAALPEPLFRRWEEISGLRLLERYGMSEVGMALSNPYRPVEDRTVGCVGMPLPGIAARVAAVDEETGRIEPLVTVESPEPERQISLEKLGLTTSSDFFVDSKGYDWQPPIVTVHKPSEAEGGYQGELLLKGPGVFSRYLNIAPALDSKDFKDGWFRTGDTVQYFEGRFRILGRSSIDIIKTAGYKVSALQVEAAILEHSTVADAAVLGIPHESQGEIVTAVVVLKENAKLSLGELKEVAGRKLAPYMLPRRLVVVDQMPRNAMGKLDKKEIKKQFGKKLGLKEAV